jgi:hypothetical protein
MKSLDEGVNEMAQFAEEVLIYMRISDKVVYEMLLVGLN